MLTQPADASPAATIAADRGRPRRAGNGAPSSIGRGDWLHTRQRRAIGESDASAESQASAFHLRHRLSRSQPRWPTWSNSCPGLLQLFTFAGVHRIRVFIRAFVRISVPRGLDPDPAAGLCRMCTTSAVAVARRTDDRNRRECPAPRPSRRTKPRSCRRKGRSPRSSQPDRGEATDLTPARGARRQDPRSDTRTTSATTGATRSPSRRSQKARPRTI